jgi:hypothetical protein
MSKRSFCERMLQYFAVIVKYTVENMTYSEKVDMAIKSKPILILHETLGSV